MGPVIGDLLPLALGIAISPVPIIAIILLLLSPRPGLTSVGFLVGWVVAIAVVVTAVALLYDPVDDSDSSGPSTTTSVVKLVLGLLSIALAVKQWGGRPKPGEKAVLPKWMAAIDKVTPVRSLDMGALLSGLNPKNLTLGLAAGVTIGGAGLSGSDTTVALVVFVVLAASSVAVPVLAFLVAREQMQKPLDELRTWLTDNNATVMAVLMLVIGVALAGKGLGGLI